MIPAVRVTYRSRDGAPVVEDLIGPSDWELQQYEAAIRRQRPGVEILELEPITRDMILPRSAAPAGWWVTMRVPGRPITSVRLNGSHAIACRAALRGAEPGAQIVRIVPAHG